MDHCRPLPKRAPIPSSHRRRLRSVGGEGEGGGGCGKARHRYLGHMSGHDPGGMGGAEVDSAGDWGIRIGTSMSRVEGAMQARVMRIKKGSTVRSTVRVKTYRTLNPPNRMTESS